MAISAPEAFAQGKVTRPKKQSTVQTQKPKKNKQKQTKPKPTPKPPKPVQVSKTSGFINGHGYVDLGLPSGLKWAACNIGASSPEGYGNYYAWGETSTKTDYSGNTSLTYGKSLSGLRSAGIINSSDVLNSFYDAARSNWGSTWRMPTKAEMEELKEKCTWTWTTQGGKSGYKVTGPNGKSIFLPAAGYRYGSSLDGAGEYGHYWSSSAFDGTRSAYNLSFDSSGHCVYWGRRYYGFSVRPVSE